MHYIVAGRPGIRNPGDREMEAVTPNTTRANRQPLYQNLLAWPYQENE